MFFTGGLGNHATFPRPLHAVVSRSFRYKGKEFRAEVDPRAPQPLQVFAGRHKLDAIARREWRPWRLEVADVVGDGHPDLLIGIVKRTRFLPFLHTTVFVYGFDGQNLYKKWLGSTMGRPVLDFAVGGPVRHGKSTLFTLQRTMDSRVALDPYLWNGFGFSKAGREFVWNHASHLRVDRQGVLVSRNGVTIRIRYAELFAEND